LHRKSKLRKPQTISLGPDYRGSKISRNALEDSDEESADPFARDYDETEGDDSIEELEDDEDMNELDDEDDEQDESESENYVHNNDDDYDMDNENHLNSKGRNGIEAELQRLVVQDQKAVTARLSQAAKSDIAKGKAIKAQRDTFDKLLGVRIKLQKALISANTLPTVGKSSEVDDQSAVEGAESAALRLLETLSSLRESYNSNKSGEKRKHAQISSSHSVPLIWSKLQANETNSKKHRDTSLNFWANKTRTATNGTQSQQKRLDNSSTAASQTLSDVLSFQLSDMSRLVAKTEVPRSCAPVQAKLSQLKSQKPSPSDSDALPIYDDADFYGTLLQALISQRSSDETSLSALNVSFPSQPWQAAREAKTKKVVDTKASKGRRLRYTVHEKLQDSMAREDRTKWTTRQCDELFASILGRKIELRDKEDNDESMDQDTTEGIRLFA
jgi:protein AATF/BFR2